jgi:hypothetical protein
MILVYKTQDRVYFAISPTHNCTSSYENSSVQSNKNLPIWIDSDDNHSIIGASGDIRDSDILRYETIVNQELSYRYVIEKIVKESNQKLTEYGRASNGQVGNIIFIAKDNQVFRISEDNHVIPIDEYDSTGYYDVIESSMYLTKGKKPIEIIYYAIKNALKSSCIKICPIAIVDTKSLKWRYVEKEDDIWVLN